MGYADNKRDYGHSANRQRRDTNWTPEPSVECPKDRSSDVLLKTLTAGLYILVEEEGRSFPGSALFEYLP